MMPKFIAATLQLANLFFRPIQRLRDLHLILSFDYNHSSQLKTFHNLLVMRTNRALQCQRFGFQVTTVNIQVLTFLSQLLNL